MSDLKVWWIPQIPMKAFEVEVESVKEAKKILEILANYDLFQLDNHIKPEFCNSGGLQMIDEDSGEWVDYEDNDGNPLEDWY